MISPDGTLELCLEIKPWSLIPPPASQIISRAASFMGLPPKARTLEDARMVCV
jgi:hypothetical protein